MDSISVDGSWYWIKPLMQTFSNCDLLPEPVSPWVDPATLALFISICKEWPDSEEAFPKGKWASIQDCEAVFGRAIRQALPEGGTE